MPSILSDLTQYQSYLQNEKGVSTNTIKSYTQDLELFFKYHNTNSTTLTRNQITTYRQYLQSQKKDAKSINRTLSSIKSFNEFLILKGYQDSLVVLSADYIKIQKTFTSPTDISEKEVLKFMEKIKTNEPYRNYAIVVLLANTGLRISEALNLTLDNYEKETTIIGKGNKQRYMALNNMVMQVLKEYITHYRNESKYAATSPYLFVSNRNEKVEPVTIQHIFNKYSKKITPHKLRHFFASNYLQNGGDIRQLQELLGHSSLGTTQIYTHPSKSAMRKNLELVSIG